MNKAKSAKNKEEVEDFEVVAVESLESVAATVGKKRRRPSTVTADMGT